MKWTLALLTGALAFGCKTPDTQSGLRADENGTPTDGDQGFDLSSLNDTFWKGGFDGGAIKIAVSLRFEDDGNGTMSVSADDSTESQPFFSVHMATPAELEKFRGVFGGPKTFLDSHGVEVPFDRAVVITDENGAPLNAFAVLREDELMVWPVGPVIKQLDTPESEVAKCGGFAGLKCPSGMACKGAQLDKMGLCVAVPPPAGGGKAGGGAPTPPAEVQKCGGFAGLQCPPSLFCKVDVPHPDGMGRCIEKAAPTGGGAPPKGKPDAGPAKCGTIAGLVCPNGQVCKKPAQSPPDASGICVDKKK